MIQLKKHFSVSPNAIAPTIFHFFIVYIILIEKKNSLSYEKTAACFIQLEYQ